MNSKKFVSLWKTEKEYLLSLYSEGIEETQVSALIKSMNLSAEQKETMRVLIDTILTDSFYSLLLGLDGEAQIGGKQESYKIQDSAGNIISETADIEAEAYEQFHDDN